MPLLYFFFFSIVCVHSIILDKTANIIPFFLNYMHWPGLKVFLGFELVLMQNDPTQVVGLGPPLLIGLNLQDIYIEPKSMLS